MARVSPYLFLAVILAAALFPFLDLHPLDDDKFWWIPKALIIAERGFTLSPQGAVPQALLAGFEGALPHQWVGGIPDYGHPPLFFWLFGLIFWLFGYSPLTLHIALYLPLLLGAWGFYAWGKALTQQSLTPLLFTLCLIFTPFYFAQGLRADLDLLLMAFMPWALRALFLKRFGTFAFFAILATWSKEPGVLLTAPGLLAFLYWGRGKGQSAKINLLASLSPLLALGAWALIHRWQSQWFLASPERLPPSAAAFFQDLLVAGQWVFFDQGRIYIVCLMALMAALTHRRLPRLSRQRLIILGIYTLLVWIFFSTVGFFGGSAGRYGQSTHLRYFLPALLPLYACTLLLWHALFPDGWIKSHHRGLKALSALLLALSIGTALYDYRGVPKMGPERNLFGADQGRARKKALNDLEAYLSAGSRVWIGDAEVLDYLLPAYGGLGNPPTMPLRFGPETRDPLPEAGDIVFISAHGEPPGGLEAHLRGAKLLKDVKVGRAWVRIHEIPGQKSPAAEP